MSEAFRKQIVVGAAGIFLAFMSGGCGWFGGETRPKPGDITLNLGDKTELRLVWIEPMNLLAGKYEVTNRQYRRFNDRHDSGKHNDFDLNKDDQPAVNVSWHDAVKFCKWLTKEYGQVGNKKYVFRLPTETEWMTFATCGKDLEYPWGADWPPPDDFNYFGLENQEVGQKLDRGDKFKVSAPVRKSGVNAWGVYGTAGNVWEWTSDKEGTTSYIFKGGAWSDSAPLFLATARRSSYAPNYRYVNLGFRVVAEPLNSAN